VLGEHGAQERRSAAAVSAGEDVLEGVHVEQTQDFGAIDRPFQAAAVDCLREVEQRARDAGAGDCVDDGDVGGREVLAAVSGDHLALASAAARGCDVDRRAVVGPQVV